MPNLNFIINIRTCYLRRFYDHVFARKKEKHWSDEERRLTVIKKRFFAAYENFQLLVQIDFPNVIKV
jgi:CRISPR/Cas system CSM-associated protein Csm2 small subunit